MSGPVLQAADSADQPIRVSVIVPTYNRHDLLQTTLASIQQQDYPPECVEIWIIDDGSPDDLSHFPWSQPGSMCVNYVRQPNCGATVARNNGAARATGQVLVFLDDDIELTPTVISKLVQGLNQVKRSVVVGTLLATGQLESTGGQNIYKDSETDDLIKIPFGKCFTGLLAVWREDFVALGTFQDPTGGWPNWDDVDFGYRAYLAGYDLRRCRTARAIHHDSSAASLTAAAQRWYRAGFSAVRLFQRYPGIYKQLPMFRDKTPIRWRRDSISLVIRKLARQTVSSAPAQAALKWVDGLAWVGATSPNLVETMRRWIVSGQVFQGVRQGIKEYGDFPE